VSGRRQRDHGWVRRLPSGKYRARYVAPDGTERGETFSRKRDAETWRATQLSDVAKGRWVDPALGRMTFGEFVKTWEAGLYDLRESTVERHLGVVRNHLLPRFGGVAVAEITHGDVKAMVAADVAAGYSGSAVRRHVFTLRGILDAAVQDGRVGRNVADGVRMPPESTRRMRFLDADQLAAVAHAVPVHYYPLVMTAGFVGLRWGELAGLELDRVDLLRHTMTVDRQLTEVAGRLKVGPPKTRSGVRTVKIPEDLSNILAVHFGTTPVRQSGLAFPTPRGKPMRRGNFRQRIWTPAVDECFAGTSLADMVFHELRHTAAALAIDHGAHPVTIKERLGHSSIKVTMDVYGHLFPSQDAALAEALNATLRESLAAKIEGGTVSEIRSRGI
jgi:integrase